MRILGKIIPAVLLLFTAPCMAEINSVKIRSDNRPMILFEKFGFTHTGFVNIAISSVSVTSSTLSQPDPSRLGFFLLSEESRIQFLLELQQNPNLCVFDSKFFALLFTFQDVSPPPQSLFNKSYPVTYPNEYSLLFTNCNPQTLVTMDVHTELYNTDDGTTKDYLSAGLTQLPSLYFIFSLVYLCFLGFWISVLCFKNKLSVHMIHLLMGGLLVMKALSLICAAEDKHYVKVTGTPHGWDVLLYKFQFIRVVLFFTVIVLIGARCSFLKPFWQEKDKVLMIVIPLQVLGNVASIAMGEAGLFTKDWLTWYLVFLLVDNICCCAVFFPIVLSIREADGKAARNLAKLTLFGQFYIVVTGYLCFTWIVVFAQENIIAAYKYQWVSNAAEEIASFVFYMVMFYMFRPVEKNDYFVLDDEDEEAAEMALRDDEFEL